MSDALEPHCSDLSPKGKTTSASAVSYLRRPIKSAGAVELVSCHRLELLPFPGHRRAFLPSTNAAVRSWIPRPPPSRGSRHRRWARRGASGDGADGQAARRSTSPCSSPSPPASRARRTARATAHGTSPRLCGRRLALTRIRTRDLWI